MAELEVPADARRVCNIVNPRKFRVEFAKVIALYDGDKKAKVKKASSLRDPGFVYEIGKVVKPDVFDDSMLEDCSHGIHAFLTRQEAVAWT